MKCKQLLVASALVAAVGMLGAPASAQSKDQVRIGLITTLSGPTGAQGQNIRDGFDLAMDEAGGKLGGFDTEVLVNDVQLRPDLALQMVNKLIEQDKIQILTGTIYSNVALAVVKSAVQAKVFFISPNAGPAQMAGKGCSPYFFNTSWQNDQPHEAMGAYLQKKGVKSVYLIAPDYIAGHDALRGFKSAYHGKVVGETYAALKQLDFAAEISKIRAAKPDALYAFLPAGMGINFTKQYAQAGLTHKIPMYSNSTVDSISLPAIGEAADGTYQSNLWNVDFPNEATKNFVKKFEAKYHYVPTNFAAQSYDVARMIGAALKQAGGITNKDAFAAALKKADYPSIRGKFTFNTNNYPISNFYILKTIKGPDGKMEQVTQEKILSDAKDAYYKQCPMK
ncbi:MAG: ABC transporter substrate-binding protein [Burkholderiaceae bacterium]|nr:MAG: ABC transporter substrate-binding protein [Burkholderiaceae bacterium]TAM06779.1 MAG: ABC transporter substrate-binding protein [Pusillimonas sp.]